MIPRVRKVALGFANERNVSIGSLSCQKFNEECKGYSVPQYPTFILFKNSEIILSKDLRIPSEIARFINTNCGTQRGANGLLIETAGLIGDAQKIVDEFKKLAEDDPNNEQIKKLLLEKLEKVPGANVYSKIMKRAIEKGLSIIRSDMEAIKEMLHPTKSSPAVLDQMKIRYNIMEQFVLTSKKHSH
jgi:hypothetical protein